ncbi:MAG: CYTH domain-containing protein, partial [Firmicutes bacterium]|nr:CYTH domain-containing protein [Bacillota bacterium]
ILELLGDEPLVPLLETKFIRRLVQIRMAVEGGEGYLLCEAAVDTGSIAAGTKSEPICELELELLAGDDRTLMDLGAELEARYGLVPGKKSKFARGKALRNGK